MKKIAAILLIALFLVNLGGYRLVFNYAQQQSDIQLQASFDSECYNEAEMLTLTIPTNLPYQNDRNSFERVDGEVTYEGKIYKYVKRKIVDGQLVLLCLPDHNKMRLQSAKDDFFKTANDLVQSNHSKKSDHSKSTISKQGAGDYINQYNLLELAGLLSACISYTPCNLIDLPFRPHQVPGQPPKSVSEVGGVA